MTPEKAWFGTQNFEQPANITAANLVRHQVWLRNVQAFNAAPQQMYVLFFNKNTQPQLNDAPTWVLPVDAAYPQRPGFAFRDEKYFASFPLTKFSNGLSYAYSTSPTAFIPYAGSYPVNVTISLSLASQTGFNSAKHCINVGQETHPVVKDSQNNIIVPANYFDTRPNCGIDLLCQQLIADGWKNVRFAYVSPGYSGYQNWKDAALIVKQYFPNMLVGITAANGVPVTQTAWQAYLQAIPAFTQWAYDNGFKRVAIGNEEGNHCDKTTLTLAQAINDMFVASVPAKQTLGTGVELSFSFSEGERATVAALVTAGTTNSFDKFGLNAYDAVVNMSAHLVDAKAQFGTKLFITECSKDKGVFDLSYGGSEIEQASDMLQRRNVIDTLGLEVFWFCYQDKGVGGALDQFGLVTNAGKKRKAYTAILAA